ncbi:MAG: sulfite exporter TauE/SafE family protein [Canibacter sp.]
MTRSSRSPIKFLCIGLAAGVMSGLFGVGGGTIIVPLLLFWVGMDHRIAAGTSVAAILPTAIVGTVSYGVQGNIDWVAALCLAAGMVVGAQVGSWLLSRVSRDVLQIGFMGFLLIVIVSLWFIVPHRDSEVVLTFWSISFLALTGFATGILSGLLGVGGGVIVVPVLMFFFGASDLIAKGTSLAMMIPGSVSGTVGNLIRRNVDLRASAMIGLAACVAIPFATILAGIIDPFVGNVLFSLYLVLVFGQLLQKRISAKRQQRD